MRRAAATDANQKEIVAALRAVGCTVVITSALGKGFPDLVVARDQGGGGRGANVLMEIKDGSKPPSERKLTPDQEWFHRWWKGTVIVAESVRDALKAVG